MSTVESGVFPVHANDIEVLTGTETWSTIAELEEANLTIDNNTEEWSSFANQGWGSALVTGKKSKLECKGKRSIGDTGNDFIAGKLMSNGSDAYISARITMPDGNVLTWSKMACAVTANGASGKATDVGALEFTLTGHGKPTLTQTSS